MGGYSCQFVQRRPSNTGSKKENGGKYVHRRRKKEDEDHILILFVAFAGEVLPFGRRRWRKTALPLGHEIRGGALELGGGQFRDGRPRNAFGDAGIGRGGTRVPLTKARERASAHNEVVIDEIRKGRMVPSTRSGAAALGSG